MKNLLILLLVLAFLGVTPLVSQENFFYAGEEKIKIKSSPDKVVVISKADYEPEAMKSWLGTSGVKSRFDLKVDIYDKKTYLLTFKKEKISKLVESLRDNENIYMVHPLYLTAEGGELAVTDEIVVQFKTDMSQDKIGSLINEFKLKTLQTKQKFPGYYMFRAPENSDPIEIANALQESGLVQWSHPNFIAKLIKHEVFPNDPYFPRQFQLHNTGQVINYGRTGKNDADVDAPRAWDYSSGNGVTVAVIDEGVDITHPDLPASRLVNGYDYGDHDNNPSPAGDGAHGTACAGIVGATQGNGEGVTGIAPLSRIMPIKIWKDNGQSASVSDTADAIDFAWQNGAHVLSNSWGFSSASHTIFPVITAAIGRAKTQGRNGLGSVVVFAAGNTADHSKGQPGYATFPGSRSNVLTVGASDRYDKQANYSPTDNDVDIVAPSHKAYRCQIATEDFEVWTTDITGNAGYNPYHNPGSDCLPPHGTKLPKDNDNYTGLMGGTSASCPLTAGIAALLLSVNPNLTAVEAEDIIKTTAEKINNSAGTYNASGHSARYGYGRVNAHRAIVPTVIISVKPKRVQKGKPFSVKVTGSAPFGLKSIWWFGKETGIADIDKAHWHNVSDSKKVYTYKWTGVTINKKGTFTLGANARDVKYPTPGDGFPHQASEGSGIAYTTVKVPTLAGWGIILLSLLFIVSAATRKKGTSINS